MKDISVPEIIVIAALCVIPVVMGLVLVVFAVCQKTGTSDVESWPSDGEEQQLDEGMVKSDQELTEAQAYDLERGSSSQYDPETPSDGGHGHELQHVRQ